MGFCLCRAFRAGGHVTHKPKHSAGEVVPEQQQTEAVDGSSASASLRQKEPSIAPFWNFGPVREREWVTISWNTVTPQPHPLILHPPPLPPVGASQPARTDTPLSPRLEHCPPSFSADSQCWWVTGAVKGVCLSVLVQCVCLSSFKVLIYSI